MCEGHVSGARAVSFGTSTKCVDISGAVPGRGAWSYGDTGTRPLASSAGAASNGASAQERGEGTAVAFGDAADSGLQLLQEGAAGEGDLFALQPGAVAQ